MPRAFTRHAHDQLIAGITAFRRLRLMYNRMRLIGTPIFYFYWYQYTFNTGYGPRNVVICYNPEKAYAVDKTGDIELYYEEDGKTLFKIRCSRDRVWVDYDYEKTKLTDWAVWKAIDEIEDLIYPMIEGYDPETEEIKQ